MSILELKKLIDQCVFNYSASSTNKFQVPATTNTSIKNKNFILKKGDPKRKVQARTAVADKKFENLQFSLFDSV